MQAAVAFGLAADANAVMEQASFHCPGVACDFKPLESLSVCSQCFDVTDQLKKNTLSMGDQYSNLQYDQSYAEAQANCTEYRLPNGLFLNNMDHKYGPSSSMVYMSMLGTSDLDKTVAMKHLDTLIWAQTAIRVNADPNSKSTETWPNFKVNASECALYYCARSYKGDFENGLINITSTELKDHKRDPQSWEPLDPRFQSGKGVADKVIKSLAYDPQESIIRRTDLQLRNGTTTGWNVTDEAVYGISYYMQTLFADCLNSPKNCTKAVGSWGVPNGFYLSTLSNVSGEQKPAEQFRPSVAKVLWETGDLGQVFNNIAASMSNAIRTGADGGQTGKGDILQPTTVYFVAWPWVTLHIAIELGGIVLLIFTIRSSKAAHIWKSSELAVLSKGVALGDILKEAHTAEELEELAKNIPTVLVTKHKNGQVESSEDFLLVDRSNVA